MDVLDPDQKPVAGFAQMFHIVEGRKVAVGDEEWDNIDTDHPTRRIKEISSVVEVSAVTFPAYAATSINARSEEALESAKAALESAKQKRTASPDGEKENDKKKELELLKLKIQILGGK